MQSFVPLETHSMYSLGEGTLRPSELAALAKAAGQAYLSVADTNSFAGLVNVLQACQAAGLKPLVAARLKQGGVEALLIARSMRGYARISHLISRIHLEAGFQLGAELAHHPPEACYVITAERALLAPRHPGYFAEIHAQKPGYGDAYRFAKANAIPPVLLSPSYFRDRADFETHRTLCAIHRAKNVWDLSPGELQSPDAFFPDRAVVAGLAERFAPMPDALSNAGRIAEAAQFPFPLGQLYFPKLDGDSYDRLRAKCLENAPRRYGALTPAVRERLAHELEIIRKKGFCDYFLVVEDIVRHGGMYTCGRGSAAASIVSYLLFITHVDPLAHRLYFERFLNEARPDPPDIDIDFAWDEKDKVTQYVFDAHGAKCARVSNHIRYSVKSALHEVAKIHGVPESEIMALTRHISTYYDKAKDEFIDVSENKLGADASETWKKVVRLAVRLSGLPRFLGLHCGGTIVVPKAVSYYAPVYRSAKGFPAIQWEKDQTEDFGLVKIDLLGNRSLAVVRDALRDLEENEGLKIPYEHLDPLQDGATQRALALGETIGVFYVESPAMRQLQKKTGVGDYEHLVIHSSIIRPAANDFINDYIRRLKGEPWTPLLPEMGEILQETYGIMVYQEDISKVAVRVADFTVGEGEELRKVIGNPRKEKRKAELQAKLRGNMANRGIPQETIAKIWDMIESFSGYSFCKPHSASYAQLSFKACWLKVHHPAEFMAGVLTNQGGFYGPSAYLAEARRMGLAVHAPDVNLSRRGYFGRRRDLYAGFMAIKDLPGAAIDRLLEARRKDGAFTGLAEFMARTGISLADTRTLIRAGCFERLEGPHVPRLLYAAARLDAMRGLGGQLAAESASLESLTRGPAFQEPTPADRILAELSAFGFILSVHPMAFWGKFFDLPGRVLAREVARHAGRTITVAGVLITTKTVQTKHDDLMKFVTWEDETGVLECVLFPAVYEKYGKRLETLAPYRMRARVDVEFGTWILNVSEVERLDPQAARRRDSGAGRPFGGTSAGGSGMARPLPPSRPQERPSRKNPRLPASSTGQTPPDPRASKASPPDTRADLPSSTIGISL
ncbi:MAG: DNA polymerase III subunit alpha [Spirochaetes bacterium]|nr:DNA polymerase III subunit alpha [Spirochaetota bacterium]